MPGAVPGAAVVDHGVAEQPFEAEPEAPRRAAWHDVAVVPVVPVVPVVAVTETERGGPAILGERMDQPVFNAGHSAPDPQAGDPAAEPGPDVIPGSNRTPARVLARAVSSEPHGAPVGVTGDAPSAPALGVDIESLVTEDDTPVDNMPSEKQQRLLTEPLFSSWAGPGHGRTFVAAANVGVFPEPRNPAIVPDMFLSLDVQVAENWWDKRHRSYFVWEFGKPPDLVVEIVSNQKGREVEHKRDRYAEMGVGYYVIHDPLRQVMDEELRIYRSRDGSYERQESRWFPELRLGLMLWDGVFEAVRSRWLRWLDERGMMIPTGGERADEEQRRADEEHRRADEERQRAEHVEQLLQEERQRAERLAALLRRSGIDPEQE